MQTPSYQQLHGQCLALHNALPVFCSCLDLEGPKTLVWVSQGKPNPFWDGERWDQGTTSHGDPDTLQGAFDVSSVLLPPHFHLGCSRHMALLQEIPSQQQGDGAGWMQVAWRDWSSVGALCPVTSQCGDDLRPPDMLAPSRAADLGRGTLLDGTIMSCTAAELRSAGGLMGMGASSQPCEHPKSPEQVLSSLNWIIYWQLKILPMKLQEGVVLPQCCHPIPCHNNVPKEQEEKKVPCAAAAS